MDVRWLAALAATTLLSGCESSYNKPTANAPAASAAPAGDPAMSQTAAPSADPVSVAPAAEPTAAPNPSPEPSVQETTPAAPPVETPAVQPPDSSPAPVERDVASAQAVAKNREQAKGILAGMVRSRVSVEQKLIFQEIKRAMEFYKATNGNYPRSHEEFMREIIEPNKSVLRLPELQPGERYVYDPQDAELYIEREAK